MLTKTHAFNEILVGRLSRTFCGIEAKLTDDRATAIKTDGFRIAVTRVSSKVTCKRCHRCMD